MARLGFALKMIWSRFYSSRSVCPYCLSRAYILMQRKRLIIEARKCQYCGLIYRWPVDLPQHHLSFYRKIYKKVEAPVAPPKNDVLQQLIQQKFRGSSWDKTHRLDFIRRLVECRGTLLDFGCSWGYGTYQYAALGFKVIGLEIDGNRVNYGRLHLGLDLHSEWKEFGDQTCFDVILADHTLEHLNNLGETFDKFKKHSKVGTKLIIFVPNGSGVAARRLGVKWGQFIGESHSVTFTMDWFSKNLPRHGFNPRFFKSTGEPFPAGEYLSEEDEIALIAMRE